MTLDEAIQHCEEKAKCGDKCGLEHLQLSKWLKDLKCLKYRINELEAENNRLKSFCDRLVKDCKWLHTDRTPDKHGFETMVLCTNGKKRVAKFRMFDLRWYDVNNGDRLNVVKWLWQPKMPTTEESVTEKENG